MQGVSVSQVAAMHVTNVKTFFFFVPAVKHGLVLEYEDEIRTTYVSHLDVCKNLV
jgi:hypothetical protein